MGNNSWLTSTNLLLLAIASILIYGRSAVIEAWWAFLIGFGVIYSVAFLYKKSKSSSKAGDKKLTTPHLIILVALVLGGLTLLISMGN